MKYFPIPCCCNDAILSAHKSLPLTDMSSLRASANFPPLQTLKKSLFKLCHHLTLVYKPKLSATIFAPLPTAVAPAAPQLPHLQPLYLIEFHLLNNVFIHVFSIFESAIWVLSWPKHGIRSKIRLIYLLICIIQLF